MSKIVPHPQGGGNLSVELQEAMARPQLDPHPMYKQVSAGHDFYHDNRVSSRRVCASLTASCYVPGQIVAGVLIKYVNFGKGWRHRLFVLQNGVLRYYKVRAGETPKTCAHKM